MISERTEIVKYERTISYTDYPHNANGRCLLTSQVERLYKFKEGTNPERCEGVCRRWCTRVLK